jgi:hypothetical protein
MGALAGFIFNRYSSKPILAGFLSTPPASYILIQQNNVTVQWDVEIIENAV